LLDMTIIITAVS